jgi:acetyl-CoA synthetase
MKCAASSSSLTLSCPLHPFAGKPKGVVHSTGGYMVYTATTCKYVFNMKPGDVYWCTADCGWITGHSYLTYGPMLVGATNVVIEGVPTYPDAGRCWAVVDKYKVSYLRP